MSRWPRSTSSSAWWPSTLTRPIWPTWSHELYRPLPNLLAVMIVNLEFFLNTKSLHDKMPFFLRHSLSYIFRYFLGSGTVPGTI